MTSPDADSHHAQLSREYEQCQRKVAATELELKRIGAAFVELGHKLQADPGSIPEHRLMVEKDIAVLWLLLPEYIQALKDCQAKKAELDRCTPQPG
jgi:hypothetical protein